MIKGVNKNVIEISDTGNDCFERVILFVRTDHPTTSHGNLPALAKDYVSSMKLRRHFYRRGRLAFIVTALLSALCGATLTTAFFLLL